MNDKFTIDSIIERLKNLEIPEVLSDFFGKIAFGAKILGRATTRQLLCLYYVMKEGNLTTAEKAWIYAALVYVLIPGDLIPRKIFHLLGLTDDALALAFVIGKVKSKITPQIIQKVEIQLDKWFGNEITQPDEQ